MFKFKTMTAVSAVLVMSAAVTFAVRAQDQAPAPAAEAPAVEAPAADQPLRRAAARSERRSSPRSATRR